MKFRDLEKVRVIIKDSTGLDVAYAYDDLVFPEHAAFLIKFDDENANRFFCYFHEDCIIEEQKNIFECLKSISAEKQCTMILKGIFNLKQKGEEIEIHFL
jgi:hypothetical protein